MESFRYTLLILLIMSSLWGFGQERVQNPEIEVADSLKDESKEFLIDSSIYDIIHPDNPIYKQSFSDTLLHGFHVYDPSRTEYAARGNKGNMGSATLNLQYDNSPTLGFNIGYDQYNLYRFDHQNFYYYNLNRPFNNLFFSPGKSQDDFIVKANFSRNFNKGINFTIDYQRINQEGFYASQRTRSTNLALGFWKKNKNHELIISAVANANNEQHNGGITSNESLQEPNNNFRELVPITLTDAQTRHADQSYRVRNIFHLRDSIPKKWTPSISHEAEFKTASFKYFDQSIGNTDTLYYDLFEPSKSGIRTYLGYHQISNDLKLQWTKADNSYFNTGITHRYYNIDQEPTHQNINNLIAYANFASATFPIKASLQLALLDQSGDYNVDLSSNVINTSKLSINLLAKASRNTPSLQEQSFYLNRLQLWENNFDKKESLMAGVNVDLHTTKTKIGAKIYDLANPIFYDNAIFPRQFAGSIQSFQLHLTQELKLWKFHMLHNLYYQSFTEDIYGLPSMYADLDYYLEGQIFKNKMLARLGVNARIIEGYETPSYSPLIGKFYTQDEVKQDWVTLIDVYTSFKISSFRAFLKLENIGYLMFDKVYYLITNHPQNDFKFRMGFAWNFTD